jgi:beta-galactosidase
MKYRLSAVLVALVSLHAAVLLAPAARAQPAFTPPASPRAVYNFNSGWKFIKQDAPGADQPGFDDSSWTDVSTPHTYNDVDSYDEIISHSGGEKSEYMGIAWYRKHFKIPASAKDGKVFLEFEGLKQAGRFYLNGKYIGLYENGVTPVGLDITDTANFGDTENVLAVQVDNSNDYVEAATKVGFEWMGRAFNPNYGGLNHDVSLVLTGKVYQTLPLYENLKTTGIYIYPSNFSIPDRTCDINIEAQVRNESGDQRSITMTTYVVDASGKLCATFTSDALDLVSGETDTLTVTGNLANVRFWDITDPYLYDVYTALIVNGQIVDVCQTRTGFRKAEFKGGAGTGGVHINDHFVYLTGYSQRSTNDWAGLGEAYPDWMHDYNAALIRASYGNYIRWMHISPQAVDVRAFDKYGIVEVCPAGDKEGDAKGRQWDQRVEVMRDSMIFFRNHPSILFWEAGNNGITPDHMQQMVDLRKQWDPNGGRVIGCRSLDNPENTPIAEYFGVMLGQDARIDQLTSPTQMLHSYSAERRDKAPFIETEDFRDEAARRFWDDYTQPIFHPGPNDTYHWNSETFALAAAVRYYDYYSNIISNTNPAHAKWSGYASIYWADSNADGRQDSSEVARVSGKVDSVRLPKQAFYTYRVMQNPRPDIHIIGHWSYADDTHKTVYVAASQCDSVELFVNGESKGSSSQPCTFVDPVTQKTVGYTGYIYAFPNIAFASGNVTAIGYKNGQPILRDVIQTAGDPKSLKLIPHTGPNGLQADGSDVVFVDVETVDAHGNLCPTDNARVDFAVDGPATWRGGYNSGITHSTNNLYLNTEAGINRVSIRSTLTPGNITLTAKRDGLTPATLTVVSHPVEIHDGLSTQPPQTFSGSVPDLIPESPTLETVSRKSS